MKTITPYLVKFALIAALLTIVFRYFLSFGLQNNNLTLVLASSILYGAAMFCSGWYFGYKDGEYLPIFDVGFRFHLATFIVHNLISETWFLLKLQSNKENINTVHLTLLIWLLFLIIHYILYLYVKRKTIKGLDKNNLFE
ncbi:hypothetical protein [Paenimyroides aestuarii]|uniref:DUF3021 domain-containing protein n=1 Tax=Paenimyroides aestuarii TaxID=2968490 RepID=A0ABY5NQX7_9FLAO|nr:hypothetical protein [Paenimyroides aestuarii]UUV20921.1 hypothetical protein NPX36_11420 [Paenimyroides aestuarii]